MRTLCRTAAAFVLGALAGRALALDLGLEEVEKAALEASSHYRASLADLKGAQSLESAASSALLPRIAADASYRYNAEVPKIKLSPSAPAQSFGDHHNYTVGVGAQWTGIDLASWRSWQAAREQSKARTLEAENQKAQLKLRARLAYLQAQLAAKKVRLFSDAVHLAHSQAEDLAFRLKAGSSSRIDALSASNDELQRRAQFRLAQADFAGTLRDLFALTGLGEGLDPSAPVDDATANSLPADAGTPTLVIAMDSADKLRALLGEPEKLEFAPKDHARLKANLALVEQARRMADAAFSGHFPRFQAGARYSQDYPNGPVLETVMQTSFSASGSLPLFSFGSTQAQARAADAQAEAAAFRAQALETELHRDWLRSQDRLKALKEQRGLNTQRADQAKSLQGLVYGAFKVGGSSYLEVQSSSLRALEAQIDLALTETQMLMEQALLAALAQ